jgi:hypothetical protein
VNNSPVNINPVTINLTINIGKDTRLEDDNGRPTEAGKAVGILANLLRWSADRGIADGRGNGGAIADNRGIIDDAALMDILQDRMR